MEHADLTLAIETALRVVGIDHAAVLFVLETVLLDVAQSFLVISVRAAELNQRQRELGRELPVHESGVRFTSDFLAIVLFVINRPINVRFLEGKTHFFRGKTLDVSGILFAAPRADFRNADFQVLSSPGTKLR